MCCFVLFLCFCAGFIIGILLLSLHVNKYWLIDYYYYYLFIYLFDNPAYAAVTSSRESKNKPPDITARSEIHVTFNVKTISTSWIYLFIYLFIHGLYKAAAVSPEGHVTFAIFCIYNYVGLGKYSRSQRPRGLRRRSAAERLLGLRVRIPLGSWMFALYSVCVVR
jgi:hypothetical protein